MHWEDDEEVPRRPITAEELPGEIARFEMALIATRAELLEIQQRIASAIGAEDASVFDAHLLVVEDRTLIDEVLRMLEEHRVNVEAAFSDVAEKYCESLSKIDDPYLRERVVDIEDVARRVLRNLLGKGPRELATSEKPHVLAARVLAPSDTAMVDRSRVVAFATGAGSKTSHAAIMARSMGIPAVAGLHEIFELLQTGDDVLVDGTTGLLILNPTPETLAEYGRIEARREKIEEELGLIRETSSTTGDGRHIVLSANIELPDEMADVVESGAEGVGLFRTEFLYLNREEPPGEDEQFEAYRNVARRAAPHAVIIRTLDVGGDKVARSLDQEEEENPFLGCRAIRFCLENPGIFKTQLRAILRAADGGNVRLMYPMISGVQELRQANRLLEECKCELAAQGVPHKKDIEVGAMIEIPSAALAAERLAGEVAFFSIGTNDLTQYTLAVDRVNDRISHLFDPGHPAVLKLMKMVVEAAHARGIWVGVCGETAGDITMTPLLVGLGLDELSASSKMVPRVKRAVQSLHTPACAELVAEVLSCEQGSEVIAKSEAMARRLYPELFD
ncbi:MAG: phosphoenolpyruvate--protein phosphotransferase [Terrimicrobiaceae bacterium]